MKKKLDIDSNRQRSNNACNQNSGCIEIRLDIIYTRI